MIASHCRCGEPYGADHDVKIGNVRGVSVVANSTITYGVKGCTGCGAYGGSHQLLDRNPFCDCRCHDSANAFLPSHRRDEDSEDMIVFVFLVFFIFLGLYYVIAREA